MKKFVLIIVLCLPVVSNAQPSWKSQKAKLEEARNAVINEQFTKAIELYAELIKEDASVKNTNGDMLAEYAYALALSHNFDFALAYIDKARMSKSKYANFYTRQILNIMGFPSIASKFPITNAPEWLIAEYKSLNSTYSKKNTDETLVSRTELDRAYELLSQKQYIRSIVILNKLEKSYPDAYIVSVVNSFAWECVGNYDQAALRLEKAIQMMGDKEPTEQKDAYVQHLNELKSNKRTPVFESIEKFSPRFCTYFGTYVAKGIFSLNGRVGLYTNSLFSTSLNVSVNRANKQFSYNVGVSAYKTWRIFMGGLGISYLFGNEKGSFNLSPCVGLTFLNEKKTSSWDVMFNCYVPFSSDGQFSYGITIGKTIYL